jgi:hypothetical protein
MISKGISSITANPIASPFSANPGPEVVVTAKDPPSAAPMAEVMPAISSSAWNVFTLKFLNAYFFPMSNIINHRFE